MKLTCAFIEDSDSDWLKNAFFALLMCTSSYRTES